MVICNNEEDRLDLKPWELRCEECNGYGHFEMEYDSRGLLYWPICQKCKGLGKIDWLENIKGRK